MKLEETLAGFKEKHCREIVYDPAKDLFYEISEGQKGPVNIEANAEGDRDLKKIIVDHVQDRICQQLTEDGYMELKGGRYQPLRMGVCHIIWGRTKQILKNKYGVDWSSPQDRNPGVFYD